jgi:hypothetical protein
MAIWQFSLDLIPELEIRKEYGLIPISLPREKAEGHPWWEGHQVPTNLEQTLSLLLPEIPSWSPTMRLWGDERGDCASVCYDQPGHFEWIAFRVDARAVSLPFIQGICRIAMEIGCLLLTGENHLLTPEAGLVMASLERSTASKYLDDPVETLRSMKLKVGKPIPLLEGEKPPEDS